MFGLVVIANFGLVMRVIKGVMTWVVSGDFFAKGTKKKIEKLEMEVANSASSKGYAIASNLIHDTSSSFTFGFHFFLFTKIYTFFYNVNLALLIYAFVAQRGFGSVCDAIGFY